MNNKKHVMIQELQKLAENVLSLKTEYRQKRPIVIEFSGSPKAGKTSCINSLELFLKRNGFSVKIIQERASICPVSDKQSPMFNIWTACTSLSGLIGTLENKKNQVDVLILDRGIFDALCWFNWLTENKKMEKEQKDIIENFLLMNDFTKRIDIIFSFCATPRISIEREYANLLTDKPGSIMNEPVLEEYLNAINHTIIDKKQYFHHIFKIDTSDLKQDEVSKEVTSITLETLKQLLMEQIGYFEKNDQITNLLSSKEIIPFNELSIILPPIKFDMREKVENNFNLLQPIPVAIITNKDKNKILVIKKNKNAVSSNSPEKEKLLLYIGGHPRIEDQTEILSKDLLSICKAALRRELNEEIGISIALNDIEPFCIYCTDQENSKKHLAICFSSAIDENSIKLRLDSQELVLNKGKSKSGKFLSIKELKSEQLESWSKLILKHCFNVPIISEQSLF